MWASGACCRFCWRRTRCCASAARACRFRPRRTLKLPERIRGVLRCKNPRCITSTERELPQEFVLTDRERRVYRCLYCETEAGK